MIRQFGEMNPRLATRPGVKSRSQQLRASSLVPGAFVPILHTLSIGGKNDSLGVSSKYGPPTKKQYNIYSAAIETAKLVDDLVALWFAITLRVVARSKQ
ncbi:unnamed protein product [Toxocara canis]|uniref:Bac_transf domain-containing protein n=1 Tax=Toxocara canis TaxID=6265 RepID=A0A183UN98_TOXCA|nr:unnamed protein product [Toxocara canis]